MKVLNIIFYKKSSGGEPVKDWLKSLSKEDMKLIGQDLKTVEFGWPIGMPLVRKLDKLLWEVRINLTANKIARVLFTVNKSTMVLLHGFIKKSQKTPDNDLKLGKSRRDQVLKS
jgi:phage-related protein